ncbi:MAG: tRNA (N6-isopentenyl adenosine(37)-C2)-methylthiotransferase MiaB [Vicinamibacteria bacterium]
MAKGKYFIETFGCQMNVNDSEKAAGLLEADGMERVQSVEGADVIFVNTCAVRERAAEKLFHAVGRYKGMKAHNPALKIAVGGCVAQLQGKEILDRAPSIDVLVGTHNLPDLPRLLAESSASGERRSALDTRADAFAVPSETVVHSSRTRAYITVVEGCNHVCSFCVVPRTRGKEVCRSPESIVDEVRSLLDRGYHEVMLLGQTVNAYRFGDVGFPDLLTRVHDADERLWRLRFTTSHPEHVDEEFARCFAELPRLAPYLHLPVQSGADAILADMRRGYTAEEYLRRLALLRLHRRDIALTADVIVGYPGESEADFEATCDLVRSAEFDGLFVFLYSPRPGTTAIRKVDDVPEIEKKRRFKVLNEQQQRQQRLRHQTYLGRIEEVIVEEVSEGQGRGRTPHFRLVHFDVPLGDPVSPGARLDVRITTAFPNSLRGEIAVPVAQR